MPFREIIIPLWWGVFLAVCWIKFNRKHFQNINEGKLKHNNLVNHLLLILAIVSSIFLGITIFNTMLTLGKESTRLWLP